jgi:uncharacterized membrane protein
MGILVTLLIIPCIFVQVPHWMNRIFRSLSTILMFIAEMKNYMASYSCIQTRIICYGMYCYKKEDISKHMSWEEKQACTLNCVSVCKVEHGECS